MKNFKGFTLIELLVVISIIGVISSIVFVSFSGSREKAKLAKAQMFDAQVSHALGAYAVGIWRFEEGSGTALYDESGYGNDGTFNGNLTPVFPNGVYSGTTALQFDGADDYVEANGVSDDIATGSFTVEMWFMPTETFDSSHTVHQYLFSMSDGFSYNDIYLFLDRTDGTLTFEASYEPRIYCYTAQNSWTANTWYHIAAVFDDSTGGKIFVNGVQDGSTSDTGRGTTRLGTLTKIGSQYDGNQNFNGVIDNVRIYDEALSAAQIQQHYAAGAASHNIAIK